MSETATAVHELVADERSRWDAFVDTAPAASFFHWSAWKSIIETAFGHRCHFLYAEEGGEIVGVMPLVHVRSRLFANALISSPFCVYGGAVASTPAAEKSLYAAARDLAHRLEVDYLESRERQPRHAEWPSKALYYTFRREISPDEDVNLKAIPRKQRAVVRKTIDSDLHIEFDDSIDRFYDLYAYTLRNLGTPVFSKHYVQLLKDTFGYRCEIMTVMADDEPVSSVMSFYFRDEVLPYYAGTGPQGRRFRSNDYMYWQLMMHASRNRGCRVFDFGRSKQDTGPYHFKRHWGFEPQPLSYEYQLVKATEVPNLSPTNPRYERIIRAWQRLPVWLTRVIGPPLARDLG